MILWFGWIVRDGHTFQGHQLYGWVGRSISPCVYHLGPQHSKRMRMEVVMSLLARLGTVPGIVLVKKVTSPALNWGN